MERHEILRTLIIEKDGNYSQKITNKKLDMEILVFENTGELSRHLRDASNKTSNLAEELPVLAEFCSVASKNFLFVMVHHIAFDGWSVDILLNELETLLSQQLEGKNLSLTENSVRYIDFSLWQRKYISGKKSLSLYMIHGKQNLSDSI